MADSPGTLDHHLGWTKPTRWMTGLESMVTRRDGKTGDLVLYNTCTIRDNAEQKVYSYLSPGRRNAQPGINPGGGRGRGSRCYAACRSWIW